jgi:DNA-directed RNA polymerase specialized sigma24 family protein
VVDLGEFEALLARWRGTAVSVAVGLTKGDFALGEDLVQDATIRLWAKLGDGTVVVNDEDHFRALLLLFVHREWGHHIGAARVRREALLAVCDGDEFALIADRVSQAPSAESVVLGWLGGPAVAALRHVRPPGRTILVKQILEGYSAEQICEMYGYSTISVARHAIEAARAELRAAYASAAGGPVPQPRRRDGGNDHCIAGHLYTEENTKQRSGGGRDCRACQRESNRARKRTGHVREQERGYRRDRYWRLKQAELKHRIDPDDLLAIVHA